MSDHGRNPVVERVAVWYPLPHGFMATLAVLALLGTATPARAGLDTYRYTITNLLSGGVMAQLEYAEASPGAAILAIFGPAGNWATTADTAAIVPALSAGKIFVPGAYMTITATRVVLSSGNDLAISSSAQGRTQDGVFTTITYGSYDPSDQELGVALCCSFGGTTLSTRAVFPQQFFQVQAPSTTVPEPGSGALLSSAVALARLWPCRAWA